MDASFEINGYRYLTDRETLKVLFDIMPNAQLSGDKSAVIAVMTLGMQAGRIAPADPTNPDPFFAWNEMQ